MVGGSLARHPRKGKRWTGAVNTTTISTDPGSGCDLNFKALMHNISQNLCRMPIGIKKFGIDGEEKALTS